jgi:hypothetical protein
VNHGYDRLGGLEEAIWGTHGALNLSAPPANRINKNDGGLAANYACCRLVEGLIIRRAMKNPARTIILTIILSLQALCGREASGGETKPVVHAVLPSDNSPPPCRSPRPTKAR